MTWIVTGADHLYRFRQRSVDVFCVHWILQILFKIFALITNKKYCWWNIESTLFYLLWESESCSKRETFAMKINFEHENLFKRNFHISLKCGHFFFRTFGTVCHIFVQHWYFWYADSRIYLIQLTMQDYRFLCCR